MLLIAGSLLAAGALAECGGKATLVHEPSDDFHYTITTEGDMATFTYKAATNLKWFGASFGSRMQGPSWLWTEADNDVGFHKLTGKGGSRVGAKVALENEGLTQEEKDGFRHVTFTVPIKTNDWEIPCGGEQMVSWGYSTNAFKSYHQRNRGSAIRMFEAVAAEPVSCEEELGMAGEANDIKWSIKVKGETAMIEMSAPDSAKYVAAGYGGTAMIGDVWVYEVNNPDKVTEHNMSGFGASQISAPNANHDAEVDVVNGRIVVKFQRPVSGQNLIEVRCTGTHEMMWAMNTSPWKSYHGNKRGFADHTMAAITDPEPPTDDDVFATFQEFINTCKLFPDEDGCKGCAGKFKKKCKLPKKAKQVKCKKLSSDFCTRVPGCKPGKKGKCAGKNTF